MLHRQIEQQIASVRGNRVFLAQPLGRAPRDVGTTSIAVPVGSRVGRVRQVSVGFDQERNVPTAWPNSVAGADSPWRSSSVSRPSTGGLLNSAKLGILRASLASDAAGLQTLSWLLSRRRHPEVMEP